MNYTLHQLHVFLTISQTQSITKAAEVLHLTQPAISIQLKNFQDQFEIPLTEVISRRVYLTDFGWEIARAAEKILNETHAINNRILAYKGLLHGKLRVSVVSTGKYVMPYFLSDFLRKHEGIELVMDVTNRQKVISSLANNEVDFALMSIIPHQLGVNYLELMPNKLYLVGRRPDHPAPPDTTPQLLEKLPLIYREAGSGTRSMMETFISERQLVVRKRLELTSNEAVKQALLAGLGYSIMPLIGIRNELLNNDLQIIPIEGLPLQTSWMLIWHKDKKLSPVAEAYVQSLEKHKEQIIEQDFGWCKLF
ncbi:LysR family transcriptional regulator [Rudanella paleaurantiibacter]|uniref:LysR family transcriptional regulator n=1 Tax=Rudanella paleaurantiibacter TaxID=2614655 RepID=A0A7J5TTZ0_9BACT|nr:LysR family transcriptional regulator [Rudanella paleaurantiibacter]KAB7727337.1 LysR family transcriptional regulator [Rudanella paleaurantiibacter]